MESLDASEEETVSDSELMLENQQEHLISGRCGRWCPDSCCGNVPDREPMDKCHLVYVCMLLAGAGFLFPWFSFISAVDYFLFLYREKFPHVSVTVPITYLVTTLTSSTFNVASVNRLPVHCRISYGYVMFFVSLLFVLLLDIGIHNCTISTNVSFYLTLLSVVIVGLGSGGWCTNNANYSSTITVLPTFQWSTSVLHWKLHKM